METIVYEIELTDGRKYRAVALNSSQKNRIIQAYHKIKDTVKSINTITSGIHTAKQFEQIIKHL